MISRGELGIGMSERKGIKNILSSMRTDKCIKLLNHYIAHLKIIEYYVSKEKVATASTQKKHQKKDTISKHF